LSRMKGHQEAMEAAGRKVETIVWRDAEQLKRDLCLALQRKRTPATAVLSMSYSVTIAILSAMRDRDISLSDIGFIGIDDLEFASFLDPSLTAVAQPAEEFARLAVEQLLRRIEGSKESPVRVALPGNLIVRASCGCDPGLSKGR